MEQQGNSLREPASPGQVFISYAHQDREIVRRLVEAMRRQSIEVWWDQDISTGQNCDTEIDHALQRSHRVIVLWSRHSVASEEVKEEAKYARSQRKLIPVRLDDADIPFRYRRTQTVDLSQWNGTDEAAVFRELLDDARSYESKSAVPGGPGREPGRRAVGEDAWRASLISWMWVVLPSLVIGGLAIVLMVWRVPTEMEIEVTCSRVRFQSHAKDPQVLLNSMPVNSIVLHGFEEIRLPVSAVEAANPVKWDERKDEYPEDAWLKIPQSPRLVFRPAGRSLAQVTLEPFKRSAEPLVLNRIFTGPAAITLSSPEEGTLNVELWEQKVSGSISLPEKMKLIADDSSVEGYALPWDYPSQTFRLGVSRQHRLLEYSSADAGMSLVLQFPPDHKEVIEPSAFQVEQLEFLTQGPAGPPKTSIMAEGTVHYTQYPNIQSAKVRIGDFLNLKNLRSFYLRQVALTGPKKSLRMRFQGVAGKALTGPAAGAMRDLRLTRFDMLWNNRKFAALFTVLVWLIGTSIALRRYLKDHALRGTNR